MCFRLVIVKYIQLSNKSSLEEMLTLLACFDMISLEYKKGHKVIMC